MARPSASSSAVWKEIGQARGDVAADHDAVDHHLDVVLELLVERRGLGDLMEGAVDLDALEAALHQLGQLLAVFALAAAHDRRQQVDRVPSASASTRSTIWLTVWLSIGRPVAGE